jgi:unsaturated chondroitin disaccharide hydrolase
MKMKNLVFLVIVISSFLFLCCERSPEISLEGKVTRALKLSTEQSLKMANALAEADNKLPKTIGKDGKLETCTSSWWVSGFFPGQLWYMYEYTNDEKYKEWAEEYTKRVADQQYATDTHDLGFVIFCSYGNGYRLTGNEDYLAVIENASESLITRFDSTIGCIRSWDRSSWNDQWQYAVIIDNMMNLEMLEWAAKKYNNPVFSHVARTHANTTMKNHFRPDGSSYHVISYDTITGESELKHTAQGYSHSSAWARGQAWGLYGYTMMFRETGDSVYLDQAVEIADFIVSHPRLPEDKIPYWDFDAPNIPDAKRDASAGAITCSALLELHQYVEGDKSEQYLDIAKQQLASLSSEKYLAKPGENANFILKHSVGHMPNGSEVDVPLTYADYYFVEAMLRFLELEEN